MSLTKPIIYTLANDYARFGLTAAQAKTIIGKRFENRKDWDAGLTGSPRAIVYHIQDGTTPGSLEYWVGRQASSTVMIQKDGSILQIIPEQHGPWTNGDVDEPTPEAAPLLALGGNPNVWCLTIEAEGHPFEDMPDVQLNAIAWQTLDWMNRYPAITLDWIFRHGWINSVNRPNCGLYINDALAVVKENMETVTTYATPAAIPFTLGVDLGWQKIGKTDVYSFVAQGTARDRVVKRAWAQDTAPVSGEAYLLGDRITLCGYLRAAAEDDKDKRIQWYLDKDGNRIRWAKVATAFQIKE